MQCRSKGEKAAVRGHKIECRKREPLGGSEGHTFPQKSSKSRGSEMLFPISSVFKGAFVIYAYRELLSFLQCLSKAMHSIISSTILATSII